MREIIFCVVGLQLFGCAGSKSSSGTSSSSSPTALTATYQNNCSICHGMDGSTPPPGTTKVIKGTTLSFAEFSTKVRNGVVSTAMLAYPVSVIPDADLQADYTILTE